MQLHLGNKAEKTLVITRECENGARGQGISHRMKRGKELEGAAAACFHSDADAGQARRKGEAVWQDEMERETARRRFRKGAEDGVDRGNCLRWGWKTERSTRMKRRLTGRDVEVRHGSPRLATGDCHPQGNLESAQERPPWVSQWWQVEG